MAIRFFRYLLGMYCASDDPEIIEQGLRNVKTVLAENYVRPDEAEKVKSLVRERGSYKVIDRVTVKLNERKDKYEASFSNLGIKDAEISAGIVKEYEKLLVGGIWVIATLSYYFDEGQTSSPFSVSLLKTSHLLAPFPEAMIDSAFFDRFHAYIPGWEIPKMRPEFFTNRYGLIVDYLAEFFREMRKRSFADAIEKYFKLGNNLNQRDVIAVRKTVSGLMKLLYPHGQFNKEDVRQCLEYALQVRRRVKEQLKKIGGMEFYDVHFSYIDNDTLEEHFVSVKEQGGGGLIPEGPAKSGFLYTIGLSNKGMPGLYRLELQVTKGSGKLATSGLWNSSSAKEQVKIAFDYFKANASRISGGSKVLEHDFHLHVVELQNTGPLSHLALPSLVAFASGLLGRSVQSQMVVLGDMSLGGSVTPVESIAECLQVAFDAGAKKVALPMSSAADIPTIPVELFTKFQTSFYADPVDAVFKGLGVD